MGHGWRNKNEDTNEVFVRKCKCGQGRVVCRVITQESDYSLTDREILKEEVICPNGCEF